MLTLSIISSFLYQWFDVLSIFPTVFNLNKKLANKNVLVNWLYLIYI